MPEVTLVGVVSADIALNLPDERAAERTYQLLAQAVGRAGRGDRPGRRVHPDLPARSTAAIRAVADGDAPTFYDEELALRERFGSPPFGRLVKLTVGLPDRDAAEREASAMADRLRLARRPSRERRRTSWSPARRPAYVARARRPLALQRRAARGRPGRAARPPPGAPWSVDVDPESLL